MELNAMRQQARSGTRWTSLATVYVTVVDMASLMLLARLLDKSAFGLLAIVMVLIGFCNIFLDCGISVALIHRQEVTREECSTLFWLNLGSGVIFYLLLALGAPLAVRCYREPLLASLLPLIGLNILAAAFGLLHKTMLQKELQFGTIAIGEMIGKTVYLLVAVTLAWHEAGVHALVYGSLASFAVTNGWCFFQGQRRLKLRWHFRLAEVWPFLRIGSFQTGTAVINYLVSNADVLLIGMFFPMRELGGYNLAKQLAMRPFLLLAQVFTRLVGPLLARVQHEREKLALAYYDFLAILGFLAVPVFVLAFCWREELMRLFYGPGLVDYAPLFGLFCLYMILVTYGNPVGGLIMATGRTGLGLVWEASSSVVRLAAVAGGCLISLSGVVWLQLVSAVLLFVLGYWMLVYRLCGLEWRRFLTPLATAAVAAVVIGALSRLAIWLPAGRVLHLGIGLTGGLWAYLMLYRMLFRQHFKTYIRHWLALRPASGPAVEAE